MADQTYIVAGDMPMKVAGKIVAPGHPVTLPDVVAAPLVTAGRLHMQPAPTEADPLGAAITALDPDNVSHWLTDGRPNTAALGDAAGRPVSAAERDAAWAAYQQSVQGEG